VSAATHGVFLDVVHTMNAPYDVQVQARLQSFNEGERWTIDDLSLIIFVGRNDRERRCAPNPARLTSWPRSLPA
jgi:hypothetical protein